MNSKIKKFFLVLLTMTSITAFSFEKAVMMHKESLCYVTEPKVSIFIANLYLTPGYITPRPLAADLYYDAEIYNQKIGRVPHYQIGQYLYGEAVTVKQFPDSLYSIESDFGLKGTIVPESRNFLSQVYAYDHLLLHNNLETALVCQPTAKTYNADGSEFLTIPMASPLYIREKDEEFFEFFDHKSKQFKLIRKSDVFTKKTIENFALDEALLREKIVEQAHKLLDQPYQWGGQSALEGSGFDCSGLVKSAYQSCGKDIKRCVTQQLEASREINPMQLQAGDLIFLYTQGPRRKNAAHVILYVGNNEIIEACPTEKKVKKTTLPLQGFTNGSPLQVGTMIYLISFRSILN